LGIFIYKTSLPHRLYNYIGFTSRCPPTFYNKIAPLITGNNCDTTPILGYGQRECCQHISLCANLILVVPNVLTNLTACHLHLFQCIPMLSECSCLLEVLLTPCAVVFHSIVNYFDYCIACDNATTL